jgi:uncharacterized phage protein (TIGR01671 family)
VLRDIEFRGKDKETGKWAFGNLLIREEKSPVPETTETYKKYFIVNGGFENYEYEVIPETVGQYAGFLDCNSVKIFEGDIIEWVTSSPINGSKDYYSDIYIITWADTGAYKCIAVQEIGKNESPNQYLLDILGEGYLKVIGSIHDNPELLHANNS